MDSASLLSFHETCQRKGHWGKTWEKKRLESTDFLRRAITAGLIEQQRSDFGEVAGEAGMELAEDRGLQAPPGGDLHSSLIHHCALADIITSAIRTKANPAPWSRVGVGMVGDYPWHSGAFLSPSGDKLRRLCLVSSWNDERHYSEARSWQSLGEACVYNMPLEQVTIVLGQLRDGKRHGPWTKGNLHPSGNRNLRFKRRIGDLAPNWIKIWREDHDEIDRMKWLQVMLDDDVLKDVCFVVDVKVPAEPARERILEMAKRKLAAIHANKAILPDASLSICDRPRCQFLDECPSDEGPSAGKFVKIA